MSISAKRKDWDFDRKNLIIKWIKHANLDAKKKQPRRKRLTIYKKLNILKINLWTEIQSEL